MHVLALIRVIIYTINENSLLNLHIVPKLGFYSLCLNNLHFEETVFTISTAYFSCWPGKQRPTYYIYKLV